MRYYWVEILFSPVSEKIIKEGDLGVVDSQKNKIRVHGMWFEFNEDWETTNTEWV